jgi:hypothetical protein
MTICRRCNKRPVLTAVPNAAICAPCAVFLVMAKLKPYVHIPEHLHAITADDLAQYPDRAEQTIANIFSRKSQ